MAVIFLIREFKVSSTTPDFIYFKWLYLWLLALKISCVNQITHRLLKLTLDAEKD